MYDEEKADPGIFTKVADAMVVALARADFSSYQFGIIWRIIGGTWGQHAPGREPPKVMAWNVRAVSKEIGGKVEHLNRAFDLLVKARVLIYNKTTGMVGINIRLGEWGQSLRQGTGFPIGFSASRNGKSEPKELPETGNSGFPKREGFPETGPETGKNLPETGKNLPETGKNLPETGSESLVEPENARAQMIETRDRRGERGRTPPRSFDPTKNNGTLANGRPDDPFERAKVGDLDMKPARHPDYKALSFTVQKQLDLEHEGAVAAEKRDGYYAPEVWWANNRYRIEADRLEEDIKTPFFQAWILKHPEDLQKRLDEIAIYRSGKCPPEPKQAKAAPGPVDKALEAKLYQQDKPSEPVSYPGDQMTREEARDPRELPPATPAAELRAYFED